MQQIGPGTKFFRFDSEYLVRPAVIIAFWGSLIGGIVGLAITALWLHGTRWEVVGAAGSLFSLIDACLLRYGYEIKRTVVGLYALFPDESPEE